MLHISKNIHKIFIEKYPFISGPVQPKPVLFQSHCSTNIHTLSTCLKCSTLKNSSYYHIYHFYGGCAIWSKQSAIHGINYGMTHSCPITGTKIDVLIGKFVVNQSNKVVSILFFLFCDSRCSSPRRKIQCAKRYLTMGKKRKTGEVPKNLFWMKFPVSFHPKYQRFPNWPVFFPQGTTRPKWSKCTELCYFIAFLSKENGKERGEGLPHQFI